MAFAEPVALIPEKTSKAPFLDRLLLEFSYISNSAGSVMKTGAALKMKPATLSVTMGGLNVNYFSYPVFFVSSAIEASGDLGRVNLFGRAAVVFVPQTSEVRPHWFKSVTGGLVVDVSKSEQNKYCLRLGADFIGNAEGSTMGEKQRSVSGSFGFGASLIINPMLVYGTTRYRLDSPTQFDQYLAHLIPYHLETSAGIRIPLNKIDMGVEYRHSTFENSVRISVSGKQQREFSVAFTQRSELFGNECELIFGLNIPLGRAKKISGQIRIEAPGYVYNNKPTNVQDTEISTDNTIGAYFFGMFRTALRTQETLEGFAGFWRTKSVEERINAATWLAKLAAANANSTGVLVSLEDSRLSPDIVYDNLRRQILGQGNERTGRCGNINGMAAEFLRQAGIEAYAIGLKTGESPHIIALARDTTTDTNYIIDYGNKIKNIGNSIWPLIEAYAQKKGVLIEGIILYGPNNKLMGYYKGPEGRLVDAMRGDRDMLKNALIRRIK